MAIELNDRSIFQSLNEATDPNFTGDRNIQQVAHDVTSKIKIINNKLGQN